MKQEQYNISKKINFVLFIAICLTTILTGCKKQSSSISPPPPPPINKPNIIVILGDDIGYEIPTCNGGQSYSTPNIDQMAGAGMRFTQCHAMPLCSPSRFMLMTGKYNFRNYTQWGIMDQGQKTIANMLHDDGYITYVGGKWQFGGGDQSIHAFGFDEYIVYNPFTTSSSEAGSGSRYKNPKLYENQKYVNDSLTLNKYGDDIVTDSILNYMERNAHGQQPFFIYYPMMLCHPPFSPTPDDPAFAAWNPALKISDPKFFPSMVKYMDKKIGMIIDKINSLGIAQHTVVLYIGDNGTPGPIVSLFNDTHIKGGKATTTEYGTHVPLLINFPGSVSAGSLNNDLIDFTDFLPAIAGLAGTQVPGNFGIIDGVSFYPRLRGEAGTPRNWIFCHYAPHPDEGDIPIRFAQNTNYKYYESNRFYDIISDIREKYPIPDALLTTDEIAAKQEFINVISQMH